MVLAMVRVIWWDLKKVSVDAETLYRSEDESVMVGEYKWGTFQAYMVIHEFLHSIFCQHP